MGVCVVEARDEWQAPTIDYFSLRATKAGNLGFASNRGDPLPGDGNGFGTRVKGSSVRTLAFARISETELSMWT